MPEIPQNLEEYYGVEYYQIPSPAKLEKIAKAEYYKLDMIQKFVTTGRLLEIGPAYGVFAYQAKKAGFEVDVIEMDIRCCEYLTNVVDVNVINSASPHQAIERIRMHNVIAMWHVIEHLPNPWACLESAAKNLVPGGVLLIATPNPTAFQFRALDSLWPHVDAPRHLYLIPANLLIQRLKPFGLEPVMLTSNDKGAQSWNRFGWQRYLMNRFSNKLAQNVAFILGYIVSLPMWLWECRDFKGSAYTIIFQKKVDQ
ncbi:class I SAM-dependent methyltransferase [Candidatus Pacearchaeota archaeon]|nr:class I SAM-dependent methyltransferase [Candidatus Pacearchaeota archaeon]